MNKIKSQESNSSFQVIVTTLLVCALLFGGIGYFLISKNIISLGKKQIENAYIDAGAFTFKS